jgi:GntR family transcriptional regulator
MDISLSKNSDVPLRQQLAEQIVLLITTGQLRPGQQLPSVRALAPRAKVHHNTVSEAYQDLVRRSWLTRQRGSRLVVGAHAASGQKSPCSLDELINDSIQRAKQLGYSLQALTECVRNRLLAEPPDHILIVEEELGLREVIRLEVHEKLGWPIEGCSQNNLQTNPVWPSGPRCLLPITSSKSWHPSFLKLGPLSRSPTLASTTTST